MKRWIIFLGRGGTVLISIGFALLLLSLIPPAQLGSSSGGGGVGPKMFLTFSEYVLTPQQSLEVTINASGTLTVYILEVSTQTLYDWISELYSKQETPFFDYNNITRLEEFLKANPNSIGSQKEMCEGKIEYIPTKVSNATLIFSNPSSDSITVSYEAAMTAIVAPGTKVRTLAQWAIPIGFVLVIPWLARWWKERTRQSP